MYLTQTFVDCSDRLLRLTVPVTWGSQPEEAVGYHGRDRGHVISKNNVELLAREEGWFKRKVRKAIKIKSHQPRLGNRTATN